MCSWGTCVPTFQGMYCLQPYNTCRLHSRQQVSPKHCYKFTKLQSVIPKEHKLYAHQAEHNKKIYPYILYTNEGYSQRRIKISTSRTLVQHICATRPQHRHFQYSDTNLCNNSYSAYNVRSFVPS
jgi:hypothetical protein